MGADATIIGVTLAFGGGIVVEGGQGTEARCQGGGSPCRVSTC
jgi:hypothetical protein